MYIDSVVVSGLIIILLTCVMMYYIGRFALRHFRQDVKDHPEDSLSDDAGK